MPYFGLIKENMDPSHILLAEQKKKYWSYLDFFCCKRIETRDNQSSGLMSLNVTLSP